MGKDQPVFFACARCSKTRQSRAVISAAIQNDLGKKLAVSTVSNSAVQVRDGLRMISMSVGLQQGLRPYLSLWQRAATQIPVPRT